MSAGVTGGLAALPVLGIIKARSIKGRPMRPEARWPTV